MSGQRSGKGRGGGARGVGRGQPGGPGGPAAGGSSGGDPLSGLERRALPRTTDGETSHRRPMRRLGDVMPDVARALGLGEELRMARAIATWETLVQELIPAATGATALRRIDGETLVVDASAPIVAQELRLRADELLAAFSTAPGGARVRDLRVGIRRV